MPRPRGKKDKKLKPVLHIYCEGLKTEPNYINAYIDEFHPGVRPLKVIEIEPTKKNTPVQLVKEAVSKKSDSSVPKHDIFWVVYDRESEAKYSKALHQTAYDKACAHGVKVAFSNVCFEVWLLLHFVGSTACYSSFDNLMNESPLKKKLEEVGIKSYEKGADDLFGYIKEGVDDARRRAKRMNEDALSSCERADSPPYWLYPYTAFHLLLDEIDDFVDKNLKKK